ncbi:MAG: NAD(P)/FAD-dependent oxidoreductase [Acidimicrobiia bacterium]|nr:NAD(P)/FAD-dependent oxidoreductase [Acidimicrobiia bacterium]
MADVAVVGAGLAGLSTAVRLREAGLEVTVLEAADDVGGRVRTDAVDGFLLDRGFQVYLTAYPEGRAILDHDALDLRAFEPGALVWFDGRLHRVADPLRRPTSLWSTLRAPIGSPLDKLRVARLRVRLRSVDPVAVLEEDDDRSTLEQLRELGFSDRMIDRFFRPLFAGITLDRDLSTSAKVFRFVFGMLTEGVAAVPAAGMGAIPRQLADRLGPGIVRLGTRAERVEGTTVRLADGGEVRSRAIVIATEGPEAARLVGVDEPRSRGVTGLYFSAPVGPIGRPVLALDGETRGPVNNVAEMSAVAPGYASRGRALVAVQALGTGGGTVSVATEELKRWFGLGVEDWEVVGEYRIPHAQPDQRPPFSGTLPARLGDGRYVAGDHRASASINGALRSGRLAAAAVAEDLGVTAAV